MKRSCILLAAIFVLAMSGCTKSNQLVLSGTIEATQIDVNSEISGKVIQTPKDEGNAVNADEILAVIDGASADLQVKNAEAGLKAAQAKFDEIKAGSRAEQILQAEAAVKQAKANLDQIKSGSRPEQIQQADAVVDQAVAKLNDLKNGSRAEQISQQEAVCRRDQENVETTQKKYDSAAKDLARYKNLLSNGGATQQQVQNAQDVADAAYQQVQNAQEQMNADSSQLELLKKGNTDEAIRAAEAAVQQAQAARDLLKNGSTSEQIRAAEAAYEQAQAQWELLKNGSTAQSILAAEANVEQQQTVYDNAKLQADKYKVKSPINGTVLYKTIDIGQVVSPGTTIATVQENRNYWIKVYVPQKYNGRVSLNQKVKIRTSSLPGQDIEGTVIFKSPKAEFTPKNIETTESKEENTVIAIKVRIDTHLDKLSPGMIASVYID